MKRILRSGAAAYVLADSIDELAGKLAVQRHEPDDEDPAPVHELTSNASVHDLVAAFLRESVEHSTRLRTSDRSH